MSIWFKISEKSSLGRKSIALLKQIPRAFRRATAKSEEFDSLPPLIANSFPKSGTHLLAQILEAFPGIVSYGTFLASMPSVTYRERSHHSHRRLIGLIVPGELLTAHLFYNKYYQIDLALRRTVQFFIYRDVRDVAVSEAYYLTFMNRWHRLHKYYRTLPSNEARISFSILGASDPAFPYDYPNIAERFKRYEGWIGAKSVFSLKFEDLISNKRKQVISNIVDFYIKNSNIDFDKNEIIKRAISNINPSRSHTFREGQAGGWKRVFTDENKDQMKAVAGNLLIRQGYENNLDW